MAASKNFLAVDLGASSGRVLLGRWDGNRFGLQELHRFANGGVVVLGHLHWDVLRLWQELLAGLARYAAAYDAPLAGIGIDSWAVDYGLLDGKGRLLGNPYHYRDQRTDGVAAQVFARLPWTEVFARTGIQQLPFNTLYQLASMQGSGDPQLAAAETLLLMPDLLGYWLTGRKVAEYTNATTTQMLDCRTRTWATDMLAQLGLPAGLLPPLVEAGSQLGALLPEVAAAAGLSSGTPIFAPGTHDTASAVAAIPGLDDRSAYISSGTWSLVGLEVRAPIVNDAARASNVTNEGGVYGTIRLLKNVTGLWLVQECQRRWQQDGQQYPWEELLALAGMAPSLRSLIDPDAPAFLHPTDMPAAIRASCRQHGEHVPDDVGMIVRCCLESIALKYRMVLEVLERLAGRQVETIRIVGGGSQNQLLCQFTADACGRPVVAGPVEATALGNILVQAITAGHLPDLAAGRGAIAASVEVQRYEPNLDGAVRWDDAFARITERISIGSE
jgi:rhamnulokinase